MLFGRRRASFTALLFAPLPDEAPPGGGGPAPVDPPPAPAAPPKPPPPPVTGPEPAWMKDPQFLSLLDQRLAETDKRARAEAEKSLRERLAEEQRLEKLSVEERAKQEAATAKGAATKAANDAAEARAEANFLRALLGAGLQPQDELCESMAWQAAKKIAGDGNPVTADTLKQLHAEKTYLFKSTAAPSTSTNPAEVAAARKLSTLPAAPNAAAPGPAGPTVDNAYDMTDAQWKEFQARHPGRTS